MLSKTVIIKLHGPSHSETILMWIVIKNLKNNVSNNNAMTTIHSGSYIPHKVSEGGFGDKTMVHPSTKNSKANVKQRS